MKSPFTSRFARCVTVTDSLGSRSAKAFLYPVSVAAPEAPVLSPAGARDARRWKLLLEPMELTGEVTVTAEGRAYLLLRRETIGGGDHIEGLLCRIAGDDENAE